MSHCQYCEFIFLDLCQLSDEKLFFMCTITIHWVVTLCQAIHWEMCYFETEHFFINLVLHMHMYFLFVKLTLAAMRWMGDKRGWVPDWGWESSLEAVATGQVVAGDCWSWWSQWREEMVTLRMYCGGRAKSPCWGMARRLWWIEGLHRINMWDRSNHVKIPLARA